MNKNFTLAFILLVTLSVINAQTQWDGCQDSEGNPIPQLNVAVTPDPPVVGNASFSISGNLGDSVPVFDLYWMYMNDTNNMVWYYGDFICGGDDQKSCQSVSSNNFEIGVTINFPVLMESINIVIYDTNLIPDESPYLGCVFGYFRDSRQFGTLPLTFSKLSQRFHNTSKYNFISLDLVEKYSPNNFRIH
ncbi:hypothetical protein F8M41_012712 [Gigaspora margarita]|uniref:Uncharacterized protein n=1 Tax=Gigaspora margarita TaxID=4874 RepID=A0A8H4ASV2_GIGMA|nr:hypothetical protein F8M41_012712 [Gigaspora margarita]